MSPLSIEKELELVRGSAFVAELRLYDENDEPEDLSTADKARFVVCDGRDEAGAPVVLVNKSTLDWLTINASTIDVEFLSGDLTAVSPGSYLGDLAVRFGDDDHWVHVDQFTVKVIDTLAPNAES